MSTSRHIDSKRVNTYRAVCQLVKDGSTAGERKAARAKKVKLEQRFPGIEEELDKVVKEEARSKLRKDVQQTYHVPDPPPDDPTAGLFGRLRDRLKRHAVEWATETLTDAVEHGAKQAGVDPTAFGFDPRVIFDTSRIRSDTPPRGGAMTEQELIDILNDEDDGCLLEWESAPDEDVVIFTAELPKELWMQLVRGEHDPATFLSWLNDTMESGEGFDPDEDDEEEPDEEEPEA